MALFRNANLIDGMSSEVQEGKAIRVKNGRIAEITHDVGALPDEQVTDLQGFYVTPGLIDAHVHLITPFVPKVTPRVLLCLEDQIKRNLRAVLTSGVTTVRDMAAFPRKIQAAKKSVIEDPAAGPRIVCANSYVTCFGGTPEWVPYFRGPVKLIAGGQAVERARDPEETARIVRRMVDLGADWVKTCHSDRSVCIGKGALPTLSDASYRALFDEADRLGKPVAFHQYWLSAFKKGLEYEPATFEHVPVDGELDDGDIESFVEAGIGIIPTMIAFQSACDYDMVAGDISEKGEELFEPVVYKMISECLDRYQKKDFTQAEIEKDWIMDDEVFTEGIPIARENVRRIWDAGGRIGCGTDAGGSDFGFFGFFHRELTNLVDIGLSPFEALRCATVVNAEVLGMDGDIGTLEPGKYADMVVVRDNPLEDISAMGDVEAVYKGGVKV